MLSCDKKSDTHTTGLKLIFSANKLHYYATITIYITINVLPSITLIHSKMALYQTANAAEFLRICN